jgi:DNA-binding response OmpR family regulator
MIDPNGVAAGDGWPSRLQQAEGPSRERTALIVDDDEKVRAMLVELLSRAGFSCVEAPDGEQALRVLSDLGDDRTPHLSVLDLALPGMSGAELAWKLRGRLPGTPIVALSGHLAAWDSDDLKDLGFDRVFPKPMDCDDFIEYCRAISAGGPAAKPC